MQTFWFSSVPSGHGQHIADDLLLDNMMRPGGHFLSMVSVCVRSINKAVTLHLLVTVILSKTDTSTLGHTVPEDHSLVDTLNIACTRMFSPYVGST